MNELSLAQVVNGSGYELASLNGGLLTGPGQGGHMNGSANGQPLTNSSRQTIS